MNYYPSLDGLRGIAVLLVFFSHLGNEGLVMCKYINFSGAGKMGVYLFFVLSAFLLDKQIWLHLNAKNENSRFWLNYFLRRFLRIYPLFVVALIIFLVMHRLNYFELGLDYLNDILKHLLLLEGVSIFWSIAVEFKYYFLSPFIMYCLYYVFRSNLKLIISTLIILILSITLLSPQITLGEVSTFKYLPIFFFGTALSFIDYNNLSLRNWLTKNQSTIRLLKWVLIAILFFSIPGIQSNWIGSRINTHTSAYMPIYGLIFSFFVVTAIIEPLSSNRFLNQNCIRYIGKISYSVYLFHLPTIYVVMHWLPHASVFLKIIIIITMVFLLSSISFQLIERKLNRIRIS